MLLKIGELAKRAGLTVRTLHHYDHIGLLSPSARSDSGFRLYNQSDVVRLHRIQALKQFGYSLSDIRAFLTGPGASPIEIITEQMKILDEQVQHAQTLRDRLGRLKERISKGEDTGLTDWLGILELMTAYEMHLSQGELAFLRSNKAAGGLDEKWRQLVRAVQDAMDRRISPEGRSAQSLAWRWIRLLRDTTGNDPILAAKLAQIHREVPQAQPAKGVTPEMIDYLTHSFTKARTAILAKYLGPGDLELVVSRQAAHAAEWPPLIAGLQQQIKDGATPDDPAVQALADRWESLCRESYWGDDPELEGKIRSAFKNEPELLVSIGLDPALLAFVQRAVNHIRRPREDEGNRTASGPKPTALRVATLRAVHQLLDRPLVFEDPLSVRILGAAGEELRRSDLSHHNTPLLRGLRTSVAVRSRLAEDEWAQSKQRGVRQCVILGAGLDTLAYRTEIPENCRIFEVDLPATQRWKRDCLHVAGIDEPASLTFVPVDFESSTLAGALEEAGFLRNEPGFLSWLGVTMYLEEAAVSDTLRFIASLAVESSVIFDYAVHPSLLSAREQRAMEAISDRTSEYGEPWKTCFKPALLSELLFSLGFSKVEDLGPEQLNGRYLSERKDGLRKSGVSRLVCAWV